MTDAEALADVLYHVRRALPDGPYRDRCVMAVYRAISGQMQGPALLESHLAALRVIFDAEIRSSTEAESVEHAA